MKIFACIAVFLPAVFQAGFAEGQKENQSSMSAGDSMTAPAMKGSDDMMEPARKGFFDTTGLAPYVVPFTTEAAARALAAKGPTVYFFAASWCPNCRAAMKDIRASYKSLAKGATLVLVNYDTASALKTRYGVTYQHTFVQIDKAGKPVAVWSGTSTVARINSRISGM
ncbi:MAG: redoxin domain-containing protein [Spirochaetales bacterium]|nr:redoxin domain-containing protein [Spirochaetales bacterium]